ncbi:unnamed protein product [Lactuca saligna]|uniref:Uncharacterized protein n=1 Tax=Lactuca saligna TaxID=75948 RepID=A0AA35ZCF7_LACSI|nr:unnamed protein product [Lactuca saligna]
MKSCIVNVNALLSNIIETRDSLIMITVKKHLADKLRPMSAMLNILKGVSESNILPKQGENKSNLLVLKSQLIIFPLWTLERIMIEAIDNSSKYWLKHVTSFDVENSSDSQLNLPITPKAFQLHCVKNVANLPFSDNHAHQILFYFYLKHMKPQYETWS